VIISRDRGGQPAMVVFVDRTECRWLRLLKRGFRHCFVALQHGRGWLVCDSLKGHMELTLLELPRSFDLGKAYADQGHYVLLGRTGSLAQLPSFGLAPLTCVSVAKRLLAVRAGQVWTPWQLFRHLLNTQPEVWRSVPANKLSEVVRREASFGLDKPDE
jgi:hypothetical protein